MNKSTNFGFGDADDRFVLQVQKIFGIPYLPVTMKIRYYTLSYYRAIKKRIPKLSLNLNILGAW
jgi:hypothetical protein